MNHPKELLHPDQLIHLGGFTRLSPIKIVRLSAERNYTYIHQDNGQKVLVSVTLKRLEDILNPSGLFLRVNRKDLINVNFIAKFLPDGTFILKDGEVIVPSRRRINTMKIDLTF